MHGAFLPEHPEISSRKSLRAGLCAYEDFCQHVDRTDSDAVAAFLTVFPRSQFAAQANRSASVFAQRRYAAHDAGVDEPATGREDFRLHGTRKNLARHLCARLSVHAVRVGRSQVVVKVGLEGRYEADMLGKLSHRQHHAGALGRSGTMLTGIECSVHAVSWSQHAVRCARSGFRTGRAPQHAGRSWPPRPRGHVRRHDDEDRSSTHRRLQRMTYVDAILNWAFELAEALQHAHDQGILARDLKPSNVLVTPAATALVLDFNLACQVQQWPKCPAGRLPYMAPEQMRAPFGSVRTSSRACDVRADVFRWVRCCMNC